MRFLIFASIILMNACGPPQVVKSNIQNERNDFIGTRYFTWEDDNREDPYYGGKRIINTQIWYPIDLDIETKKYNIALYYYGNPDIWKKLNGWSNDDVQFASAIQTKSLVDVPVTNINSKFPVIIFSPSLGGNLSLYNYYAEYLTRHGYIVVGVNHLFESEFVLDKNNRIISQNLTFHDSLKTLDIPTEITADDYRQIKGKRSIILGQDLVFCLNMLSNVNAEILKNKMDFDKIGIWGHSVGGSAATQASLLDDRFKAVLNIDGTPPTLDPDQNIQVPYMFIEDLTNYEEHTGLMKQYIRRDQFCENVNNRAFRVLIGGIDHASFLDINYHSASDESERERSLHLLNKTSSYMLEFFNYALLDEKSDLINMKSDSLEVKIFEN